MVVLVLPELAVGLLQHLLQLYDFRAKGLALLKLILDLFLTDLDLFVGLLSLVFPYALGPFKLVLGLLTQDCGIFERGFHLLIVGLLGLHLPLKHLLKQMIGHERVTLITYAIPALVDLAQAALLLAAVLADCLTAPLAVVLENDAHAPKCLAAEHTEARIKLENGFQVEDLRQMVDRTGAFIL